jgi:Ca-activated chloride channel family protein
MNQGGTILASAEIEVSDAAAGIVAPATSGPGAGLIVEWTGPDYDRDYITIAEPGGRGSDYLSYVYAKEGSPTRIEAPDTPGDYEIRYVMHQGARVLATAPLRVD